MLFVSKPSIGIEELQKIKEVLDSGWLGHGSKVLDFEDRVKDFLGAQHVVAVNTGTSALHLALDVLGVGKGDEVIVPSLTFCASVQVITALGATPVFCEVSSKTLNIDPLDARGRITSRTRAIMPVHFCGNACDMEALLNIGEDYGIRIIEDAAHAFGASYRGRKLGSFGDVTCFSFDPIKNITCGEGGAIAVADENLVQLIRCKRMLGINKDSWQRHQGKQRSDYKVTMQGYRCHMNNLNAAIGLAQMEKIDSFMLYKRNIVERYQKAFQQINGIETIDWDLTMAFPFAYVIRVSEGRREDLIDHLGKLGIGTCIHYAPNHLHPYFHAFTSNLPVTERLGKEILTLPLHCSLTENDVSHIIASVCLFFDC